MYISKKKLIMILLVIFVLLIAFFIFKYLHLKQTEDTTTPNIASNNIVYAIKTSDKKIALTVEVNISSEDYTNQIIDVLDNNNIKATFFLTGNWIEENNSTAKKIVDSGHEVENHSNTHSDLSKMMTYKIAKEILKSDEAIASIYNKQCSYFRPPFSYINKNIVKAAKKTNKTIVMYSLESYDWKSPNVDTILNMVNTNVKPGDIISFHNDAKYTADALVKLIPELKNKGYVFLTINELLNNINSE
jgi:peptidoglycan/xylan/chitin deacetylase (PgdA/CDA1 family)